MQIKVDYPNAADENKIVELARAETGTDSTPAASALLTAEVIATAKEEVKAVYVAPAVQEYMVQLVVATRNAAIYESGSAIAEQLNYGASPRASIALDCCSRARAWLNGRDYVIPDDVQALAGDCLRHRLVLSVSAHTRATPVDEVIADLLTLVPVV